MAKKEEKIPANVNQVKELKLYFSEDKFYKGELAYKKGVHNVETKLGWAARWIARGAKLVVGDDHLEVSVGDKGEITPQGKPAPAPEETVSEETVTTVADAGSQDSASTVGDSVVDL